MISDKVAYTREEVEFEMRNERYKAIDEITDALMELVKNQEDRQHVWFGQRFDAKTIEPIKEWGYTIRLFKEKIEKLKAKK